jgi:hypothetical protein
VPKLAYAVASGAARTLFAFTPQHSRARADAKRDLREARAAFARFIALEAAHDPALLELYADDGVVIERWIEGGVEKPAREVPLRRYKEKLAQALAVSRKAGEASRHSDISYERVAPGWVIVRSWRDYTHSRALAPYEAILKREPDGHWRVTKEIAAVVL